MIPDTSAQSTGAEGTNDNDTGAVENEELLKLRTLNERLKGQLTDVEKKYNQFSSMYKDIDPDEARALKAKLEETERKSAEKDPAKMEEMFNRKFQKVQTELQSALEAAQKERDAIKAENKTLRVTDKVMAEIAGMFNEDAIKFIKREVEQFCDLDDDGSTIIVKDEDGNVQFRNGKYVGIKDFGEMLADKYPSLAKRQGIGGAKDASPGHKRPGQVGVKVPESYAELMAMPNSKQVLADLQKNNPDAIQKILSTMTLRTR
jgi:hypothetical protein